MARKRGVCSIDGCENSHIARGWCDLHYNRWLKHGDPLQTKWRSVCSLDGCENAHKAHGWCDMHYQRWRTYGDPLLGLPKGELKGELNPSWVGDDASYATVHKLRLGNPKLLPCVDCGEQAIQWSYIGGDPFEKRDNSPTGLRSDGSKRPYSVNPDFYAARCGPCHKFFDGLSPVRLFASDVEAICAAYAAGETQMSIAARFGVGSPRISRIILENKKKEKE